MQVFETFTYNLNSIKFKDTKDYFDGLLGKFNMSYTDIMFCFAGDFSGNICGKVTKAFPHLSEYVYHLEESELYSGSVPEYYFTSIKNNGGQIEKYIKAEHKDSFSALLKKIPNPINFGFMGVVLDNVNWYKEEFQEPAAILPNGKHDMFNHRFHYSFSNSVRFFKEFDFGNKMNLVEIMIERPVIKDSLAPYPHEFDQFLNELGKPKNSRLKCVFNDTESKMWADSSEKFRSMIEENNRIDVPDPENKQSGIDRDYLLNSVTPISGFSPKAVFSKIAKVKGYKPCFCKNGCYRYQRLNENNHLFEVEFLNRPFSAFWCASVSVEGYNFKHNVYSFNQITVNSSDLADTFAKSVFDIAVEMEHRYTDNLLSLYGKTPAWYVK